MIYDNNQFLTTEGPEQEAEEEGGLGVCVCVGGYSSTLIDYTNLLFLNGLTLGGVLLSGASSQIHIPAGKEA